MFGQNSQQQAANSQKPTAVSFAFFSIVVYNVPIIRQRRQGSAKEARASKRDTENPRIAEW
jgi:hypothetical protein